MTTILKDLFILGLVEVLACAAPTDEHKAVHNARINGIAIVSTVVIATLAFFFGNSKRVWMKSTAINTA